MWGFWWILPVIGVSICLVFTVLMIRAMAGRGGSMCMGESHGHGFDETAELRREIRELREELKTLRPVGSRLAFADCSENRTFLQGKSADRRVTYVG